MTAKTAVAAVVAAAVLALTSTGSFVVAAGLVALVATRRAASAAVACAVLAAAVRFGTASSPDLAGLQSVLGAAGIIGPPAGAASAWLGAIAIVAATTALPIRGGVVSSVVAPAVASGALAATVVIGPGPGPRLPERVAATAVFVLVGVLLAGIERLGRAGRRRRPATITRARFALAPVAGGASVVAAVISAADRSTATGAVAGDLVAITAVVVGVGVAIGNRVWSARSSDRPRLTLALAAVVAGVMLAAQGVDRLTTAGGLLAVGGLVAMVAGQRVALVALGPGGTAFVAGFGATMITVDPRDAPVLMAAVVTAVVLVATAAPARSTSGARIGDGGRWIRTAGLVVAVGFAVRPGGGGFDGRAAYLEAAAVASAVAALVLVGGRTRLPAFGRALPGSLWRRSTRLTPSPSGSTSSHGLAQHPAEEAARVDVDQASSVAVEAHP